MKFRFLGTAAAEGIPSIFCDCEACRRSWKAGGRSLRTRSQAIVNDDLLIDFPPDTFSHLLTYGIDIIKANHCLITHVHTDHYYPVEFNYLHKGYAAPPDGYEFHVYGSEDVVNQAEQFVPKASGHLFPHKLERFVPEKIGRYTVTAMPADHGTPNPNIYLISDGEKTLLYGHDTGIFKEEVWEYLQKMKVRLDLVTMDCTGAAMDDLPYSTHMCLGRDVKVRDRLLSVGTADNSTIFIANHFSHNGLYAAYEDFRPLAAAVGFETSYDGMTVEI